MLTGVHFCVVENGWIAIVCLRLCTYSHVGLVFVSVHVRVSVCMRMCDSMPVSLCVYVWVYVCMCV